MNDQSNHGYWALSIETEDVQALLNLSPKTLVGKQVKHEFHVTLAFNVTEDYKPYTSLTPKYHYTVYTNGIAVDEKAAALVLFEPGHLCITNPHPHITIALADGVKPVYCNEMLGKAYMFYPFKKIHKLVGKLIFVPFN